MNDIFSQMANSMNGIKRMEAYCEYDRQMETRDEQKREIPFLKFPSDWEVKITPPFGGACIRFRARKGDVEISVYLDWYDHIGCVGQPYWELFPNAEGDCSRYLLDEHEEMMKEIDNLLNAKIGINII